MIELEIPDQHKLRWMQLTQMPMLEKVPYFHDAEIEYIKEIAALTAQVERLKAPVSLMEWSAGSPLSGGAVHLAAYGAHICNRIIAARAAAPVKRMHEAI